MLSTLDKVSLYAIIIEYKFVPEIYSQVKVSPLHISGTSVGLLFFSFLTTKFCRENKQERIATTTNPAV